MTESALKGTQARGREIRWHEEKSPYAIAPLPTLSDGVVRSCRDLSRSSHLKFQSLRNNLSWKPQQSDNQKGYCTVSKQEENVLEPRK